MKEMWDERYASESYVYGTEPNVFFKRVVETYEPEGRILLPAEGEGKNAVYAAKSGLEVTAFDFSIEGQQKAFSLAKANNVKIEYILSDIADINLPAEYFDAIGLFYVHLPEHLRQQYHQKLLSSLKADGLVVLEGFSKDHIEYSRSNPSAGGPKKIEMLFDLDSIRADFEQLTTIELVQKEIISDSGQLHKGQGSVIQYIGRKPGVT